MPELIRPLTDTELALIVVSIGTVLGAILALRRAWALPRGDGARELAVVVCTALVVAGIGAALATYADGHRPDLRDVAAAFVRGSLLVAAAYVAVWGIRGSLRRR